MLSKMVHTPTIGANKKKGEIRKGYTVYLHQFQGNTASIDTSQDSMPNVTIVDKNTTGRSNINVSMTDTMIYKKIPDHIESNIHPSLMKHVVESRNSNKLQNLQTSRPRPSETFSSPGPIISVIPLVIYQTWYTKNLPPVMKNTVNRLISDNPRFQHVLYDDNECREFIQQNFDQVVVDAFDSLIPGAYKADLWRYCILYKNGGIYIDIKYQCIDGFSLFQLTDKEYFVRDIEWENKRGIYNALMVCQPGNQKCWDCIQQIVENVKNRFYGDSPLEPTGPQLLAKYFSDHEYNSLVLRHDIVKKTNGDENFYIFKNDQKILVTVGGYRKEQKVTQNVGHYTELWGKKQVYL
jgi:mannosyltransferase OCH1-like enzyme